MQESAAQPQARTHPPTPTVKQVWSNPPAHETQANPNQNPKQVWHTLAANNPDLMEEVVYGDPEGQRRRREELLRAALDGARMRPCARMPLVLAHAGARMPLSCVHAGARMRVLRTCMGFGGAGLLARARVCGWLGGDRPWAGLGGPSPRDVAVGGGCWVAGESAHTCGALLAALSPANRHATH